jgi:hypothetical protein
LKIFGNAEQKSSLATMVNECPSE